MSQFAIHNHKKLYQFNLGDPEVKDEYGHQLYSEFVENKQHKLAKARLPVVTPMDASTADSRFDIHQRVVDFHECYKFSGNRVL